MALMGPPRRPLPLRPSLLALFGLVCTRAQTAQVMLGAAGGLLECFEMCFRGRTAKTTFGAHGCFLSAGAGNGVVGAGAFL